MTKTARMYLITIAKKAHIVYAEEICKNYEESAKVRGTGIAKRTPEYVSKKMEEGKAIIALTLEGKWAGFCYIESWGHGDFVANSGLIVAPDYRKDGLAKEIKKKVFLLSREKYPKAKIFGLTTGLAVMRINSLLGYKPVPYSELTTDEEFWSGCKSCINFDILTQKNRNNCLCTAMLYDPNDKKNINRFKELKKNLSYTSIYLNMKSIVKSIFRKSDKEKILYVKDK